LEKEDMKFNKKDLMILGLTVGIILFFLGIATAIALGPTTDDYQLPRQVGSIIRLSGMGIICIAMIVGGFFIEKLDKDIKHILLIFGLVLLLLNIFVLQYLD
jgi:hypothetical protein